MRHLDAGRRLGSRGIASFVALSLAACTTITRVTIPSDQIPRLAGMSSTDERVVQVSGQIEPVTINGDDEILLLTRSGRSIPAREDRPWPKVDQLSLNPPMLSVVSPSQVQRIPISNVRGADLKLSRGDAGLTVLAIVLGVAGLVGVIALSTMLASKCGALAWCGPGISPTL
jgi:hypothetical protein